MTEVGEGSREDRGRKVGVTIPTGKEDLYFKAPPKWLEGLGVLAGEHREGICTMTEG